MGKLKELGYPIVYKLWYYNEMNVNDIVMLKYNKETKRMKTIAVMTETCHSYITHPLTQPDIIEEPIFSLEYPSLTVFKDVLDEEVNLNEVSTMFENIVGEGYNLDKGTTVVEVNVGDEGIIDMEENVGDEGAIVVEVNWG